MFRRLTNTESRFTANPVHGGKVTCHKCGGFIDEDDLLVYKKTTGDNLSVAFFHKDCYNRYEHYYGLDKPID